MINLNCIIDGNYLLHRHVFTLHKNNMLFGGLEKSLEVAITNYRKWYPFSNIYFVSDSKKKSWRSKINTDYKMKRKKDSDIDWAFVYSTYDLFKGSLKDRNVKLFELDHIEGDDWVSIITEESNKKGQSNLIISNDYDIKQIIRFRTQPPVINFMTNEIFNKQKFFFPTNYKVFIDSIVNQVSESIFDLNDDNEFLQYVRGIQQKFEIVEVDDIYSLLLKVISGDISDNIKSVFPSGTTDRKKGIGGKGAESVLEKYKVEFGEPNLQDPDLFENIADLICEKKKLNRNMMSVICENIKKNMRMINLSTSQLPEEVVQRMKTISI